MSTFLSPIAPRPRVRLMPTADELLGRTPNVEVRQPLFSAEAGGVEPADDPVTPGRGAAFGYQRGTATPQTDDRAARAGFLSRGYTSTLSDPGGDRRAARNADIGILNGIAGEGDILEPMVTPTSRESAQEREYLQAQVEPEERRAEKQAQDVAATDAGILRDQEISKRLQRQAAEQAFFERTGMPYDEKLAAKIAEFDQQASEDEGYRIDNAEMDKAEQDALSTLPSVPDPAQVGVLPGSPQAVQMDTAKKAIDAKRTAIKAHFDTERRNRLMIMAIRAGASSPGAAFAPPKVAPDPFGLPGTPPTS